MLSNNLNSSFSNILTLEIYFYFPKLYSSPLMQTQLEWIIKQLLLDFNWLKKAI